MAARQKKWLISSFINNSILIPNDCPFLFSFSLTCVKDGNNEKNSLQRFNQFYLKVKEIFIKRGIGKAFYFIF